MSTIIVYGIPNCDTIKKTLDWYKKENISVTFFDYKKQGINKAKLQQWCRQVGWEVLLNKKSTTWRSLSPETQQSIVSEKSAIQLMVQYPTLIKRPVIELNDKIMVGLKDTYFTKQ